MPVARWTLLTLIAVTLVTIAFVLPGMLVAQQPGKLEVLWLGQAAFKITTPGGKVIVTETPAEYKNLDKLGKVDLILVTHGHGDHIGDVKELAAKTGAKVYGPAGLIQTLVDLGWFSAEQGVRFGKGGSAARPADHDHADARRALVRGDRHRSRDEKTRRCSET
jgi:L-ascorbate metabolism protein UlaG (beta-lactamase superfamily)